MRRAFDPHIGTDAGAAYLRDIEKPHPKTGRLTTEDGFCAKWFSTPNAR
jgi:hypothetical protein